MMGGNGVNWTIIMQVVPSSLQAYNHTSTSSLNFYRPKFFSLCPTNCIKALPFWHC